MGKLSSYYYRPKIEYNSNLIKDIHLWLNAGHEVYITYDPSQISRKEAIGLLKLIPLEDVFKVRVLEKKDFEAEKAKQPEKQRYPISAEEILKMANKPY